LDVKKNWKAEIKEKRENAVEKKKKKEKDR